LWRLILSSSIFGELPINRKLYNGFILH
jgi:hypothetical protein